MKLGVKIGPEKWREVLQASQAQYCEVWYRLDWADRFVAIFDYLNAQRINFGLHFWAQLPGGFEPNLAWEADGIAAQSQQAMLQAIDTAAQVGAAYVNVHPGAFRLKKLYLDEERMELVEGKTVTADQAWQSLDQRTQTLPQYACSRNVLFLVEMIFSNGMTCLPAGSILNLLTISPPIF